MEESVIYQDILQKGEARGEIRGEARGEARGKIKGKAEVAKNLLNLGMTLAQIAEVTGLTIEQVSQLESE